MAGMFVMWVISVFGQFTVTVAAVLVALLIWDRWPSRGR